MADHAVVVAGGGPTGLMLAGELALAGVDVAIVERRASQDLAGWVDELEVPIHREREVREFVQDATGVDVQLSDGMALRADYLVGCDGGRSVVRKAAGIEFPGWEPTTSTLIAEVQLAEEPKWGVHDNAFGRHAFSRLEGGLVG